MQLVFIFDMLIIVQNNRARIDEEYFYVDRKFHAGMQSYVQKIRVPILSVHPESGPDEQTMDLIKIPIEQLGYRVMTLKTDRAFIPLASEIDRLREQIAKSSLVYGNGLGSIKLARKLGVPYILLLENGLKARVIITTAQVSNFARKIVRAIRCTYSYVVNDIPAMRAAYGLHCNGYPIFDESGWFNSNRLLYLDSRMSRDMVISDEFLNTRLSSRSGRPLRLLFSGRYEPIKGAADTVLVAIECLKRGMNVEMHCYGQGSLRSEMVSLAASYDGIHIHDAIPYPELVKLSYTFDVFVCCHIQDDPSCTYLETFGGGLPIIGYGNRMWLRLNGESKVGFCSPIGDINAVADQVQILATDFEKLAEMSRLARQFAINHTFENEFARRTDAINAALADLSLAE